MSDGIRPEAEEHLPLRRLLKELPPVEASPDFEQRLLRKIREGKPLPAAAEPKRRLFAIPVFAYSLLTLLLVGVISYYTFYRNQESAPVREARSPEERLAAPSAPADATPAARTPVDAATARPKAKSRDDRSAGAVAAPAVTAPREDASRALPRQVPAEEQPAAPAQEEPMKKDAPQENAVQHETAPQETTLQAPAFAPAQAPSKFQPENVLKDKFEKFILPESAGKPAPVQFQRGVTKGIAPAFESSMAAPSAADSASLKDSTALDSLRKARTPARIPSKVKPRRPGN